MRTMRRLLLSLILTLTTAIPFVDASGPPPVPGHAKRARVNRGFTVLPATMYQHTDAAKAAAADCELLSRIYSPEQMKYIRYLTVHNLPPEWRHEMLKVTSWSVNSLSRSDVIVVPAVGGPDNILIRINLHDYGIKPGVWDKFGEKDPYFHQKIVQQDIVSKTVYELEWVATNETYLASDGRWYYKQVQQEVPRTVVEKGPKVTKLAAASWLDTASMMTLIAKTQSTAPILRADWFITYATQAPNYYEFTGFKTLEDYLEFVAYDRRAKRREAKATIVTSGSGGKCPRVARNNRILAWTPTFNGGVWETYDYLESIGASNVIKNFLNDQRDAGEYIGNGNNGLQYYFLVNEKNERVDEGLNKIVVDSMAVDTRVINGRSCMWCHSKGINDFTSQFQRQVGANPFQSDLGFSGKDGKKMDPKAALELQQYVLKTLGTPNFKEIIDSGCKTYAKAVRACNNLTPEETAALFKKHWDSYFEDRLDLTRLSYELGYPPEVIKAAIPLRLDGQDDGVLLQQLLEEPISIRRDHWEEAFPGMMMRLMIVKNPKK